MDTVHLSVHLVLAFLVITSVLYFYAVVDDFS